MDNRGEWSLLRLLEWSVTHTGRVEHGLAWHILVILQDGAAVVVQMSAAAVEPVQWHSDLTVVLRVCTDSTTPSPLCTFR